MLVSNYKIEDYIFIIDNNIDNEGQHEVDCGSTHKYSFNEGNGIFEIEIYKDSVWHKASNKAYWIISEESNFIKLIWLVKGKYRIVWKDETNKDNAFFEVNVVPNKFKLALKSEKVGFAAVGLTEVPFKIKKNGGAKNNWKFKYSVSLDDGISWTNPKEVIVNYDLYGDEYSLNYNVFIEPGYGNVVVRFKLIDGRDFFSTQSNDLNNEKFYVLQRIPLDLEGILVDKERLLDEKHIALFGSECEYSCTCNSTSNYNWEIFKESGGKTEIAEDTDYTIVSIKNNYLKIIWHNTGSYVIGLCLPEKNKTPYKTIKYKQNTQVVKNSFTVSPKFEFKSINSPREGLFPVSINKIGGAKNNWKFRYTYKFSKNSKWIEDNWVFVDYKKFGDNYKLNIINNSILNNKVENIFVKILEARDYNNTLNSGEEAIAELSLN